MSDGIEVGKTWEPTKFLERQLEELVQKSIAKNGKAMIQVYMPHTITVARAHGIKIEDNQVNSHTGHLFTPTIVEIFK